MDIKRKVVCLGADFTSTNILADDIKDFRAGLYIFEINDNRQLLRKRFLEE